MYNNKKNARNMKNIIYLKSKMPLIAVITVLLMVWSCGSYQYVGVDNDGIYGETPRTISQTRDIASTNVPNSSNEYYQNYFKSKALEYEKINEEGAIFTDIDSYQSGNYQDDTITNEYQGYGGWGQTNSQVTINIQPTIGWGLWTSPFYGGFYGSRWNRWGYYDSFYGGYYGSPWNHWGYYDPFYSGFYGGFYGGWYNTGFYAFNRYNNYYYGNRYHGPSNVSYSASRRNTYPSNNVGSRSATSNNNTSRYNNNNTYRRSNTTVNPNSATSRTTRNASPAVINGNSTRRNSNATPSSNYNNNNNNSTQYRRSNNNYNSPNNNSGNYSRSTNSGSSNNSGSFSRGGGGSGNSGGSVGGGGRRR